MIGKWCLFQYLKKNEYKKARKLLDSGYDIAKVELEKLRGGDTLVRSLNFANPEEEYEYELDRNDTHRMLVTVLLEEKRGKKGVDKMVKKFMGKAEVLRKQAEAQAHARAQNYGRLVGLPAGLSQLPHAHVLRRGGGVRSASGLAEPGWWS